MQRTRGKLAFVAAVFAAVAWLPAGAGGHTFPNSRPTTLCTTGGGDAIFFAFQPAMGTPIVGGCQTYDWQVSPAYSGSYYSDPSSADAAEPPPPAPVTPSIPTWRNFYDWPNGNGYVGWHSAASSQAGAYGMQTNLGGQYGLWLWPVGGQSYSYTQGQYAEWTYTAPGTTRLSSAALVLSYKNKLLAHHCIDVGFRDGTGAIVTHDEHCIPVQPPDSQRQVNISLVDPSTNPTSKVLYFRIRVDCGGATTCSKNIPALDPLSTGGYARLLSADMTLVDDDQPIVEAANTFHDDLDYVNGHSAYPLTIYAHDPGSGVSRAWAETTANGTQLVGADAPCDPTHHTPALDARICPEYFSFTANVDTSPLPEGQDEFVAKARDVALNVGASDTWRLYVDRTAPITASNFVVSNYDTTSGTATVSWDEGNDPDLADGSPGSGVASTRYSYQVNGGGWSSSTTVDDSSIDIPAHPGDTIAVQVGQSDLVANADAGVTGTVTVTGTESDDQFGALTDTDQIDSDVPPAEPPDEYGDVTQDGTVMLFRHDAEGRTATTCSNVKVSALSNAYGSGWTFTNCDAQWTIYRTCYDSGFVNDSSGREYRQVVGPGYIAYVKRAPWHGGGVIVNDLARMYSDTVSSLKDPTGQHGYMGAIWGGLGEFGIHFTRGTPGQLPAGWDPSWPDTYHPSAYVLAHMKRGARDHLPSGNTLSQAEKDSIGTQDARQFGALEERMCSRTNGGYGIKSVGFRQYKKGNDQWLRITDTLGDPVEKVIRITRIYDFGASNVRVWIAVTELATTTNGTPFVKEPKFGAAIRGGKFTREVGFVHDNKKATVGATPNWIQTAGQVENPNAVLKTKEVGGSDHERVEWDYGTSNCDTCVNVVMRAYPIDHRTSITPNEASAPWRNSGLGLDKWAAASANRAPSYQGDTYDSDGVVTPCVDVRARDIGDLNGDGTSGTDADKSIYSRGVTPATSSGRQWELEGGWAPPDTPHTGDQPIDPVPYYVATGALFHGWEGNRGPYDCEEKQVAFGPVGETFGTFASYSVGPGWTRR